MTSTTTNAKASRNGHVPQTSVTRAGTPLPVREKRPAYIALAVVLIVGLAAACFRTLTAASLTDTCISVPTSTEF